MLPSALTSRYEALLVQNLSTVQTVESAIRNITWLLPGRFEDAEVASEALYAVSSVVSSYHDSVLSSRLPASLALPPHPFELSTQSNKSSGVADAEPTRLTPLLPPTSDHTRYTKYWTARSGLYRKASRLLSTLRYVELLVEMLARRRGDGVRWKAVLWIESIKTFLRLLILRVTRRPVLYPSTPQREYDISMLPQTVLDQASTAKSKPKSPNPDLPATAAPTPVVSSLPPNAPLRAHLLPMSGCLPEEYLAHPLTLLPELDAKGYAAEIISSTATLMQVVLMLRSARRDQSPSYRPLSLPTLSRQLHPFLLPLLMRLISRQIRTQPGQSVLLSSHYAQSDRRLAKLFFLTGPMWVGWTRPKVMRVVKGLERLPLIGLVGGLIEGYLPLVDDNFYYTSN